MLACVAGAFHMPLFIAGAITMGRGVASSVVEIRSSAMPLAILAMILAVAGATTTRSGSCASEMWWMGSEGSSNRPTATGSLVSARKVSGPTNSVACLLITTLTRAPRFCNRRTILHDL